jgi:hypothetical protein
MSPAEAFSIAEDMVGKSSGTTIVREPALTGRNIDVLEVAKTSTRSNAVILLILVLPSFGFFYGR